MSYLQPKQMKLIPETLAAMSSLSEFYRQLVSNLELMANWYNKVMKSLLEVEFPLVEKELQSIDLCLRAAEETLNWKTEGNRQHLASGEKIGSQDSNQVGRPSHDILLIWYVFEAQVYPLTYSFIQNREGKGGWHSSSFFSLDIISRFRKLPCHTWGRLRGYMRFPIVSSILLGMLGMRVFTILSLLLKFLN